MRWRKGAKADPAAAQSTDPNANDPATKPAKARRQMPSIRLPFGMMGVVCFFCALVILDVLAIILATSTGMQMQMVSNLFYAFLALAILAAITAVAVVATGTTES